jgi:hypothetical protein
MLKFKSEEKDDSPQIRYVVLAMDYGQEVWPTSFNFTPKINDVVQSRDGRHLKITSIVHCHDNITQIKIGKDFGGSEPTGGGGGAGVSMEPE